MFLNKFKIYLYLILIILSLIPKIYLFQTQTARLQNEYDGPGHIDYIKYVSSNFSLPPWWKCWECSQQPIYYITVSIIYKYLELMGLISETSLSIFLQLFSFFLFYVFLLISIAIFRLTLPLRQSLIASSLLLFWPSGAIHASRIGNDLLLYVTMASSLYFLIHWWIKNNTKFLITSIGFLLTGILTKTNALIMLPVIVSSYLLQTSQLKKVIIFLILLSFVTSLTMLINQRNNLSGFKQDTWLVGNWKGIPEFLYVGNSLRNFIYFDMKSYLQYPNVSPYRDEGGRQFFWNYLIKTSLFAELTSENTIQQTLAKVISLIMLALIGFMFFGLITLGKVILKLYIPLLLTLFSFISAMIIYRVYFPCGCTNDFRFIYPVLIPFLFLVARSDSLFSKNRPLFLSYIILLTSFIFLSFIFHLIPV